MSHYADYLNEREGVETLEVPEGFATYRFEDDGRSCYIVDIYVEPKSRKSHVASKLADMITVVAKEAGCERLLGSVAPGTAGDTESLKVLLAYGFRLAGYHVQKGLIFFYKDI